MAAQAAKYRFLELVREADAITRGSQVGEKNHHTVYRLIRRLSSIDLIRSGQIYTMDTPVPELQAANLTRKNLSAILKNLIDDHLIAQLFLVRAGKNTVFEAVSCYIALPPDELLSPNQLYYEMILKSVANIEEIIRSLPVYGHEEIEKDLEIDFAARGAPPTDKLAHTILDPVRIIVPGIFDFVPDADLLRFGKNDLKEELIRRQLFVELFEYGMMPLKKEEIVVRFEVSADFLANRLIPHYRDRQNLKAELEPINVEESAYYLDPFAPRNADFIARKAAAMKKNLIGQSQGDRVRFPGLLAVEQILQLTPFMAELYREQDRREIQEGLKEFLTRLRAIDTQSWQDMALYLSEDEVDEIHPDILKQLLSAKEVMNSTWETAKGTMLILARKDRQIFEGIVKGMAVAQDMENWHVLALKFMIEKYESEFPNLFQDADFRTLYGKLLRKVYLRYIPFFQRILIYLGIRIFQDKAFQRAKERIMEEQNRLALENKERKEVQMQKRLMERRERMAKAQDLGAVMRIIEKVDACFRNGELPSASRIAKESSMEPEQLLDFLKKNSFQILQVEGSEDSIVLYPLDQNWRVRSARLLRLLDSWKEKQSSDTDPDRALFYRSLPRIRRLLLDRRASTPKKKDAEDPYEKFSQELKKYKQKSEAADLEV
jgi:hypothetical protein